MTTWKIGGPLKFIGTILRGWPKVKFFWFYIFWFSFFREFQPMISALDNSSLSSDQDTNWFLV